MTHTLKYLRPALIAFGLFAVSAAHADVAKNGDGGDVSVTSPENGSGETDKNGGGETDKNGGGETVKNGGDTPAPPRGGQTGGSSTGIHQITCVVDGRVFQARSVTECGKPRHFYFGSHRSSYAVGRYDGYAQTNTHYYRPSSRAAIMQAEKRARYHYSKDFSGRPVGYGDFSYGIPGNCNCGAPTPSYLKKHRRHKIPQFDYNYSETGFYYDPGVAIHYGPTITKDGGY